MAKISNQQIVDNSVPNTEYPPVIVEQTNVRISEIIRRNQAGEQVLGVKNLQFDYHGGDQNADLMKVNPFSDMGFDLDDVILLAERNGQAVTDLQNRVGELKQSLDKARSQEEPAAPAAPQGAPAPSAAAE